MNKAKLIEMIEVTRAYGFSGVMAIIDHPKYGRLLIEDGYGGENTLAGGCVRWRHGSAYQLQPVDTFGGLNISDVVQQADNTRPWLGWDGCRIEKLAKSLDI